MTYDLGQFLRVFNKQKNNPKLYLYKLYGYRFEFDLLKLKYELMSHVNIYCVEIFFDIFEIW